MSFSPGLTPPQLSPSLRLAGAADRPALEQLWQLFQHDLSDFRTTPPDPDRQAGDQRSPVLPGPDGRFRDERLQAALSSPDRAAYLVTVENRPAGFALLRDLDREVTVLSSFFVVRGLRRRGAGRSVVRVLLDLHPGRWRVACQDANPAALSFWRRIATDAAGTDWIEQRLPVPHRPDLAPDVWLSFSATTTDHPHP